MYRAQRIAGVHIGGLALLMGVATSTPEAQVTDSAQTLSRPEMELVSCVLRIIVDGIPKEWGYDMNLPDPREAYGVEIYAGPSTIPAQHQSMGRDGYCGAILIWTRPR